MGSNKSTELAILKKIHQKVGKAIQKYHLIDEGDHILVGLSGGKDSMVLLEALAGRRKYHPVKFELTAIHIGLASQPYTVDLEYLHSFTDKLQVPFIHRVIEVEMDKEKDKNPCFFCSWNRRKVLFQTALESGYQKLALGHHMDDAIQTLLMNMTFQSSISSMPPSLPLFDNKIKLIRPLSLLTEEEVKAFAEVKAYKKEIKSCIYDKDSKRKEIKQLIGQLVKLNPKIRTNLYASMTNIQSDYLPMDKY